MFGLLDELKTGAGAVVAMTVSQQMDGTICIPPKPQYFHIYSRH